MASQHFYSVLLALGIAQGILLALALLTKPNGNRTANELLATLIFLFVLDLSDQFASITGFIDFAPKPKAFNWALDFLYGPTAFLYVSKLVDPAERKLTRQDHFHLFPFMLSLLVITASWI